MDTNQTEAGSLLQRYGFKVHRRLRSRFPSLTGDAIDDVVAEAIARVWRRHRDKFADGPPEAPRALLGYIVAAADRLAMDRLRYGVRIALVPPKLLTRIPERDTPQEGSEAPEELAAALRIAIARLAPLDQRVLRESMSPSPSGEWAISLAQSLIKERKMRVSRQIFVSERRNVGSEQWEKNLPALLRIRKCRALGKLRELMRNQGYSIPEKLSSESQND